MKRNNILFIMTDQMRLDAISALGLHMEAKTPNLDTIAKQGVLYDHVITTCPICAPARASMLLGLYPSQMGVLDNSPHTVDPDAPNWIKTLRRAGYQTSVFGKTHYYPYNGSVPDMRQMKDYLNVLGLTSSMEVPGPRVAWRIRSEMWQAWKDAGCLEVFTADIKNRYGATQAIARPTPLPIDLYPDVFVPEKAMEYLKHYHADSPFFCMVSFPGPHDPWDCPETWAKQVEGKPTTLPLPKEIDRNPSRPKGLWDENPEYNPVNEEEAIAIRRNYAAHVALIDHEVGELLDTLKAIGHADDTLIFFVSDHGELNGDYKRIYKQNFHKPAMDIPFLIAGPDIPNGIRDHRLGELLDVGPTVLACVGLEPGYRQEGISLLSEERTIQYAEYKNEAMITDGKWKLSQNGNGEPYQLFDLIHDPGELVNLAYCGLTAETYYKEALDGKRQETQHRSACN